MDHLMLEVEKVFVQASERAKSVNFHPTEPWILAGLYSGTVCIWNYQSKSIVKSFKVSDSPVRSAKFVARKQWIVACSDDQFIRVYNYETMEKIKEVEAHTDYIRSLEVHPTLPYVFSSSDDMLVKVWDWEKDWTCTGVFEGHSHYVMQGTINPLDTNAFARSKIKEVEAHTDSIRSLEVHPTLPYAFSSSDDKLVKVWDWEKDWTCTGVFEGHSHYVMQVAINPLDTNAFASVSLDGTIKVWNLDSPNPQFTIDAHERGINCISYFLAEEKLYLVTGADDHTVKVWDYETKSCVKTLEGHTNNVTAVCVHPEIPIIISSSEDGNVCIWHAITYKLLNTSDYGFERVWAIGYMKDSSNIVFGFDQGVVMVNITTSLDSKSQDDQVVDI